MLFVLFGQNSLWSNKQLWYKIKNVISANLFRCWFFFSLTSITLHFKWILKKIPTFLIPWRSQDKNLLSALQTFFLFLVKMSFFFQMGGFIWHFQAVWPSLKSAVCEQIKPNDGVRFFCTTEPRQPVYPGTFQSLNSRKTLISSATWNCFRLKKAFEGPTFK